MDILGSSAGLSNMSVAMSFAAVCMIVEQSALAYTTYGKRERLTALTSKEKPAEYQITDSTDSMLQGIRAFALVSLFGVLFMSVSSPLIAGSRLMATKEFSYLLLCLSFICYILAYNMFSIKTGLTRGERSTRQGMMLILFAFQIVAGYQVFQGSNILAAKS